MEQQTTGQSAKLSETATVMPAHRDGVGFRPAGEAACPTCGGAAASTPISSVYAIGRIEARFPRLSVEKEFAQAAGRAETAGQTDQQVFYNVLSRPESRSAALLGDDDPGPGDLHRDPSRSQGF